MDLYLISADVPGSGRTLIRPRVHRSLVANWESKSILAQRKKPQISPRSPAEGCDLRLTLGANVESPVRVFFLSVNKCGNSFPKLREQRSRVARTLDRGFEARDFIVQRFVFRVLP